MIDLDRTIQEIRKEQKRREFREEQKRKAKIRLNRFKRDNPLANIEEVSSWIYAEDCPDYTLSGTFDFCVSIIGLCDHEKQILLQEGIFFIGDNKIEFHPERAKYYTF